MYQNYLSVFAPDRRACQNTIFSKDLRTITVICKQIGCSPQTRLKKSTKTSWRNTRKHILGSQSPDPLAQRSRSSRTLKTNQISTEPNNMRRSHRRSGDGIGVGRTVDPSRKDIRTRTKDINHRAIIRVRSPRIILISSTNSTSRLLRSRRRKRSRTTIIARSNAHKETLLDSSRDSRICSLREDTAETQVREGFAGAAFALHVVDGPLDTGDDLGCCTGAAGVEDFDGDEVRLLGDAVGARADCAGYVSAVAVAVGVLAVVGEVGAEGGAAFEFSVRGVDAGVDYVGVCPGAGGSVVDVVC